MYLKPSAAARLIGIGARTLLRSDAPRFNLGHKTVRFLQEDLEKWMASKRFQPDHSGPSIPRHTAKLPERDLEVEAVFARWK